MILPVLVGGGSDPEVEVDIEAPRQDQGRKGGADIIPPPESGGNWQKSFLRKISKVHSAVAKPAITSTTSNAATMNFPGTAPPTAATAAAAGAMPTPGGPQDPNVKAVRLPSRHVEGSQKLTNS